MTAQLWMIIAIAGFSLAGLSFITAVLMFIQFKIPAIIGDLTGKTAARQIEQIRQSNVSSAPVSYRPKQINVNRDKQPQSKDDFGGTDLLKDTDVLEYENTTALEQSVLTTTLSEITTVLSEETAGETIILAEPSDDDKSNVQKSIIFTIIRSIDVVHTFEEIK